MSTMSTPSIPAMAFFRKTQTLLGAAPKKASRSLAPYIDHLTMFGDKVNARAQAKRPVSGLFPAVTDQS